MSFIPWLLTVVSVKQKDTQAEGIVLVSMAPINQVHGLYMFSTSIILSIGVRDGGAGGGGLQPPQSCEKLPDSGKTLAKIFAMIRASYGVMWSKIKLK